ncbi:MAG: hypothetical protein HC858_06275, partial [Brachymonas sp.]|nr:hypothetical protein [Brachymonas sp.]
MTSHFSPQSMQANAPPDSPLRQAEIRVFQASNVFVGACQEATMALHALTAKIRELEKALQPPRRVQATISQAAADKVSRPTSPRAKVSRSASSAPARSSPSPTHAKTNPAL